MPHGLNIVLVEPEIPQNTGTIGRLCLATQAMLHLVKPIGFDISSTAVKRAGLDYWEHLNLRVHESLEEFLKSVPEGAPLSLIENRAGRTLYETDFFPGHYLVFGRETSGLPDWLLTRYSAHTYRIPMYDARVRSLNLSNSVSIVLYEAIRRLGP